MYCQQGQFRLCFTAVPTKLEGSWTRYCYERKTWGFEGHDLSASLYSVVHLPESVPVSGVRAIDSSREPAHPAHFRHLGVRGEDLTVERRDGVRAGGNHEETARHLHRSLHNPAGPDPVRENPVSPLTYRNGIYPKTITAHPTTDFAGIIVGPLMAMFMAMSRFILTVLE